MNSYDRIYTLILELDKKGIEREWGEFRRVAKRDPDVQRKLMAAARRGRETTVKSLKGVENTDATDIKPGMGGLRKAVKILRKEHKRGKARTRQAYDQVKGHDKQGRKKTADASIVRVSGKGKNKKRTLDAGNTRAMLSTALGKDSKIHLYKDPR